MLSVSIAGWIIVLVSMGSTTVLSLGQPWSIYFGIPVVLMALIGDTMICVANLLLIDRTGGLITLFKYFFLSVPIPDPDVLSRVVSTTTNMDSSHLSSLAIDSATKPDYKNPIKTDTELDETVEAVEPTVTIEARSRSTSTTSAPSNESPNRLQESSSSSS